MEIKQLLSNFQVRSKCTSPYFSYIGLPNKRILFLEIVVNILIYLFRVVEKCSRNCQSRVSIIILRFACLVTKN